MDELIRALLGRLRGATQTSEGLVAHSRVLAAAREVASRPERMLRRCAWCGRIRLGGQWLSADEAPEFVRGLLDDRTTHGICRSCMRRLEADGRSRAAGDSSAVSPVRESGNEPPA